MKKFFQVILWIIGGIFLLSFVASIVSVVMVMGGHQKPVTDSSILHLELEGVIMDGRDFLRGLRDYAKEDKIKGVLVQINSPGGAVGASQEIYSELKYVREVLKKPVVVSINNIAASGGYYAAVAADKVITNPGSLLGSIGVISEFANLSKLYDWAKIQRYVIKSGKFKDAGSEFRAMTPEEHALFQGLIDEVYGQFKDTVIEARKLKREVVDQYADGRVINGAKAVQLGFADQLGTFSDAIREIGAMTKLGEKPKLFKPPKKRDSWMEYLTSEAKTAFGLDVLELSSMKMKLMGQPLYLMPGVM